MAAYRHFIPLSYRLRPRLTPYSSINTLIYNSRFLSRLAEDKELSNLALFKEDHRKSKVLQALTPTVVMESKHAELLNDYILDLHLLPVDDKDARDFKNARKAGEDAADYVIEHCRKYLPLREMKPYNTNLLSKRSRNRIGFNVFGLKRCIRDGDVYKARKIYRGITRKGREIPLAAQNELLELYALKGIGVTNKAPDFVSVMDQIQERMDDDTKSEEKKNENDVEEQMQASTEDNVQSTDEKKEDSFMDGLAKRLANMHTDAKSASPVAWSKSNMAEVFFSRMKEKDGISYSAMILGTLKFKESKRAWELFKEMRQNQLQGTTAAYNALLQSIVYEIIPPKRWFSAEQLVHHMQDEPAVSPDLETFITLLKLALHSNQSKMKVMEIVREMKTIGIEPSLAVFDNMLKACRGELDSLPYEIVSILEQSNFEKWILQHPDDMNFMNTIVQVAVKLDDADLAVRIFKLADDNWQFVKSDRDFLSSFLAIICSNVEPELVWNCYSAIVPKHFVPRGHGGLNYIVMILQNARRFNQPKYVLKMWNEIQKYKLVLSERMCGAVFSALKMTVTDTESLNICRQVATECFQATQRTANPATLSSFMLGELIRLNVVCGHLDEAWKLAKERTNFKVQLNFTALQALFVGSVAASDAPATKKICRSIFAAGYYLPDTMLDKVQQSVNFDNADLKNIKSLFNLSKENGGNDFTLGLQ